MNNKKALLVSMLALTVAFTSTASSAETTKNIGIAAKVSTLGLGGEVSYNINDIFSVAAGLNGFSYDFDTEEEDIDYEGELQLGTFGIAGRYHPWSNGFFLGAGLNSNSNEITLNAKPNGNGTFEFNNNNYSTSQIESANAKVDFDGMAPQLSLGWQSMNQGVSFFTELGVMFTGKPKLTYDVACASSLPSAVCEQVRRDVDVEKEKLEDDMKDLTVWPILSAGLQYNF